jgi:mRNA interferase MazF
MSKSNLPIIKRSEIYYADLSPVVGSEQGGMRPVLIIQNNLGNKHSPTTIVAPITSKFSKKVLPTHIELTGLDNLRDSVVLCEQIRVIDKQRLRTYMCEVPPEIMALVDEAIKISLGLE